MRKREGDLKRKRGRFGEIERKIERKIERERAREREREREIYRERDLDLEREREREICYATKNDYISNSENIFWCNRGHLGVQWLANSSSNQLLTVTE